MLVLGCYPKPALPTERNWEFKFLNLNISKVGITYKCKIYRS